jgi:PAS domain S-box-containing protein
MMTVAQSDTTGPKAYPSIDPPDARLEPPPTWEPQQAAQALASTFADALARKPDLTEAITKALRRCIEARLLSAGCVYELQRGGAVAPRGHAGFPGPDKQLHDLCGQAWLLGDVLDSGQPVRVPSPRVPLPAAVDLLRQTGATTALLVPLVAVGERVGVLVLASRDVDIIHDAVVASARVVAALVARAISDFRTLQQTRTSEQRHRTAFDHSQDAMLLLDGDTHIVEANGQAEQLFDLCAAELVGRRPADFLLPEDLPTAHALQAQLLAQGFLAVHRMRIRRRDGRVVDTDATASRVRCNGGLVHVLVLRDMTNRRGAREGLAAGEERLRVLLQATGDTFFTLDRALRMTGVYGRRPIEAGLDPDGCVGKPLGDAIAADAAPHLAAARQALAGEVSIFEWTAKGAEGQRHLQTSFSPVRSSDGEIRSVVGVTRDVTERRRRQSGLLVADHMASLSLLAANVAHELSHPVAAVLTNLSHVNLLVADVQLQASTGERTVDLASILHAVEPLRDARQAAEQLRRIVQGLRSLTREERLGTIDVAHALDAAVSMASPVLRRRARVVRSYGEKLFTLGNEALLVQAFVNLIANAAQACPEWGEAHNEVRLMTRLDARGRVVVEVSDTGHGIAPENLGRIFEPFFTTRPPGMGTGLGLSIARRIVRALGGDFEVTSEVGRGTAIRVFLAQADPSIPEPVPAEESGEMPRA